MFSSIHADYVMTRCHNGCERIIRKYSPCLKLFGPTLNQLKSICCECDKTIQCEHNQGIGRMVKF